MLLMTLWKVEKKDFNLLRSPITDYGQTLGIQFLAIGVFAEVYASNFVKRKRVVLTFIQLYSGVSLVQPNTEELISRLLFGLKLWRSLKRY